MSSYDNDDLPVQDELSALKTRADVLGVSYHPSIGVDKLREKINATLSETKEAVVVATSPREETSTEYRMRMRREASELVRIRVTCMNPAKSEWEGEYLTAGNSVVGTHTKFIPFNADEGWHVPRIIYNMMVDRQCQVFTTIRDSKGNSHRKGKLIKEFAIEVLPPLTTEELSELARRQAVSQSID